MTPTVKAAGGFEYMKEHGVYHDEAKPGRFYSYKEVIPAEAYSTEDVILDEATKVYWNWTKTEAKSREEALATGYTETKHGYKGYVGQLINGTVYRGFPPDKVNKTGYLELYSALMEAKGFNPRPTYYPIEEHVAMTGDELILTTHKVNVHSHSRTGNCKWLTEIYHDNPAWINPETAARKGIESGDMIRVRSEIGEITTKARVTPAVVPGVIAISNHCGHWSYGRYASGNKETTPDGFTAPVTDKDVGRIWWAGSNGVHPNWIIPSKPDPISGEQRWNDTVVTIEKVTAA